MIQTYISSASENRNINVVLIRMSYLECTIKIFRFKTENETYIQTFFSVSQIFSF